MSEYTLHLGDCLEYMRGLPDGCFDAVVTDPPYGDINHIERLHERAKYKNGPIRKLHKGGADNLNFDFVSMLKEVYRLASAWIIIFAGDNTGQARSFFSEKDCMTRIGVLTKLSPTPLHGQYIYLSSVETFCIARKRGAAFYAHCKPPVFSYSPDRGVPHPTPKPLGLIKELLTDISKPGDNIFDPFMGSGTTGVACMQLGRKFVGCEIDPEYYAIAEKRISEAAKQPPLFVPEVEKDEPVQESLL